MLKHRILATLKFFDIQDLPLTLLELSCYLITPPMELKNFLDSNWELKGESHLPDQTLVGIEEILKCLESLCDNEVWEYRGFYFLPNRKEIVTRRLLNYSHGIVREKLIKSFAGKLRHLPFVRGVALLGSQALGQQKPASDIDLFIITDPAFMGLCRLFVTCYFQIFGIRRHGTKIANRFCLNHYLAGPRALAGDRNLYTAAEYIKLRPLVYSKSLSIFQKRNVWVYSFFPNARSFETKDLNEQQSLIQKFLQWLLNNSLGNFLEKKIKTIQLNRIQGGEFIVADALELSFHPNNRKSELFSRFFKDHQQHSGEAV